MNSLEKFYVYSETKINNPANEESTTGPNKIYDVAVQRNRDIRRSTMVHVFRSIHCHSHTPNLQINVAPPPPCKVDMSTYHNTTMLSEHTM